MLHSCCPRHPLLWTPGTPALDSSCSGSCRDAALRAALLHLPPSQDVSPWVRHTDSSPHHLPLSVHHHLSPPSLPVSSEGPSGISSWPYPALSGLFQHFFGSRRQRRASGARPLIFLNSTCTLLFLLRIGASQWEKVAQDEPYCLLENRIGTKGVIRSTTSS